MKHPRYIWLGFAFCLVVVLAAMGWISLAALRLDRAEANARLQEAAARRQEAEAHRRAAWEENIRLALWRMDSVLAPLVAQESARPYFAYSSFLPVDRAYSNMFNDRGEGEALIPSPLLSAESANILLYFQFEPDGRLTSPQVPVDSNVKLAVPQHVSEEAVSESRSQLSRIGKLVDRERLVAMLPESTPKPVELVVSPLAQTPEQRTANRQRQEEAQKRGRGFAEYSQRSQAVMSHANSAIIRNFDENALNNGLFLVPTDVSGVLMTPLWIDGNLILARRVTAGGREYVQGCWFDWPAIKASLLEMVVDLLPKADLVAMPEPASEEEARALAALPVRLTAEYPMQDLPAAEPASLSTGGSPSPIRLSLAIAWVCVLLAAVAVAALLLGVIRLSERRAAFVSAVTHELRTPLTTFQMYAEMLAEGMVSDPQQQRQYLNTLRSESARLTHLVENVLSYARLERGRANGRLVTIAMDEMIESMTGRLAARAEQAGMELVVEKDGSAGKTGGRMAVMANVSSVEQVLFNLVDNACKYASDASDKRIHLALQPDGHTPQLHVRDHGPGISAEIRRRLFCSFSKSANEAAHTAPGVGLGLALSRRLARDMQGDLRLEENGAEGACFVLTLAAVAEDVEDAAES